MHFRIYLILWLNNCLIRRKRDLFMVLCGSASRNKYTIFFCMLLISGIYDLSYMGWRELIAFNFKLSVKKRSFNLVLSTQKNNHRGIFAFLFL